MITCLHRTLAGPCKVIYAAVPELLFCPSEGQSSIQLHNVESTHSIVFFSVSLTCLQVLVLLHR